MQVMPDKRIVLIGGGGHCKSVIEALRSKTHDAIIKVTDPHIDVGSNILGAKVVGGDDYLQYLYDDGYRQAFISIGSIKNTVYRRKAYDKAKNIGYQFPTIIDSSAIVTASSKAGQGIFIAKGVIVNADTVLDDFCIINTGAIIEHDCVIGKFAHIAVGAVLCGGVYVGHDVFIGANSTIKQGVKIGMKSIIGAGSLVLADVPENMQIYGIWGGIEYKEVFCVQWPVFWTKCQRRAVA